jgi:cytochrome c-type biogenesis protein
MISSQNITTALSTGSLGAIVLCFLAGVGSSFTPCIYPLIPVTISILGTRNAESKFRGFLLTLFYVGGIATTYAALGMVAAFTGSLFGSLSSNSWVLLGVAAVVMALALNMLDVFQINFARMTMGGSSQHKQGLLSNFVYGLTFGLVASPCTAPPLAVILAWVGSTHNVIMGPLLLFVFALGMGSILIMIGTFSSFLTRLPRSGMWMVYIKKIMGYMMVLMSGYFVFQAGVQW